MPQTHSPQLYYISQFFLVSPRKRHLFHARPTLQTDKYLYLYLIFSYAYKASKCSYFWKLNWIMSDISECSLSSLNLGDFPCTNCLWYVFNFRHVLKSTGDEFYFFSYMVTLWSLWRHKLPIRFLFIFDTVFGFARYLSLIDFKINFGVDLAFHTYTVLILFTWVIWKWKVTLGRATPPLRKYQRNLDFVKKIAKLQHSLVKELK